MSLDTDLDYVKTHTRLLTRAIEWDHKEQEQSLLLRGNDLKQAENWPLQGINKQPYSTPLQQGYIGQSRQSETARQRQVLMGVTISAVVATVLALAAGIGWNAANQQRIAAEQQLLRAESKSARLLSSSGQGFDALITSLKAGVQLRQADWRQANSSHEIQVFHALKEAVYGIREQNRFEEHSDSVYGVSFSPDGQNHCHCQW